MNVWDGTPAESVSRRGTRVGGVSRPIRSPREHTAGRDPQARVIPPRQPGNSRGTRAGEIGGTGHLTNYAMDSENRLCVVLVGHPGLRRRLNMAALDALAQRVVVRAHVRGIGRDELGPYREHRLRLAGCELPLFEPSSVEAIFQASNALPRRVNLLAHHALFAAAIARAKTINTEHIQAALQEVA